jgi:hypothetical protein
MPAQRGYDRRRVFAGHLDQHGETRMTFHQGGDVTVVRGAQQIALPMAGDGAIFDFRGSFPDGDGIDDLTTMVSAIAGMPRGGSGAWTEGAESALFSALRALE